MDIVVDNAGFELITDLALAQHLVESGIASCVTFQLKSHVSFTAASSSLKSNQLLISYKPTFVSDALEKDLLGHIDYYKKLDPRKFPNANKAGMQWQELLDTDKWKCSENDFWVQGESVRDESRFAL